MASYFKKDGKWRALIRRKGHKSISKWFDTKAKAAAWAAEIEKQISEGTVVATAATQETVSALIKKYRNLRASNRPILDTSTEHYTLKQFTKNLGDRVASQLTVDDILGWALMRRDEGAGPYTINCDLSKFGTVLRYTAINLLPLLDAARPKLSYLGLTGGGGLRERRPTEEETRLILLWLEQHKGRRFRDYTEFAILTAMRRGEVSSLLWADLDTEKKLILVRNRKDPRKKIGNDQWVPLLFGSFDLILSQPRDGERIFQVQPQTISKYFKEGCDALGIPDLHFHDTRHEGISQMFEHGFDIPHVAVVSGHRDWRHLKRYTNIKPESLHSSPSHLGTKQQQPHQPTASHHQGKSEP